MPVIITVKDGQVSRVERVDQISLTDGAGSAWSAASDLRQLITSGGFIPFKSKPSFVWYQAHVRQSTLLTDEQKREAVEILKAESFMIVPIAVIHDDADDPRSKRAREGTHTPTRKIFVRFVDP